MKGYLISLYFLFPQLALAQVQSPPKPPGVGQAFFEMLPMFGIIFLIFWVLVLRPQQKKLLEQQQLMGDLKKGEQVVTSSGIIAKVASVEKSFVSLDLGNNVRLKVEKAHVTKRYQEEADKPA